MRSSAGTWTTGSSASVVIADAWNAIWLTNHDREDECRTKAKRSTS
jgi:hypothetical protein